jgi:hypothetical protein
MEAGPDLGKGSHSHISGQQYVPSTVQLVNGVSPPGLEAYDLSQRVHPTVRAPGSNHTNLLLRNGCQCRLKCALDRASLCLDLESPEVGAVVRNYRTQAALAFCGDRRTHTTA